MAYTTQRNSLYGGRVVLYKESMEIFFRKGGLKVKFPITAGTLLSLKKGDAMRVKIVGVAVIATRYIWGLKIKKGDSAIEFFLNSPLNGSNLMIVSRRGLRRAASEALKNK